MPELMHPSLPAHVKPSEHPQGYEGWASDRIVEMIANPGWDDLANVFGADLPPADKPEQRVEELYTLSNMAWNLRGKQAQADAAGKAPERWEVVVPENTKVYDESGNQDGERIMAASKLLDMIDGQPMGGGPLVARMVLGGAARACWQRTQLGMGFAITTPQGETAPDVSWHPRYTHATPSKFAGEYWGDLLAIGSLRPLGAPEQKMFAGLLAKYVTKEGDAVPTEADAMYASARYLLGKSEGDEDRVRAYGPMRVSDVGYEATGDGNIRILKGKDQMVVCYEAPDPAPHTVNDGRARANTDDGFHMLRTNAPELLVPDGELAIVSNAHFQFQLPSALNTLSRHTGVRPHMVTFSAAEGGVNRVPSQLIPEFHSTVRKLHEFTNA